MQVRRITGKRTTHVCYGSIRIVMGTSGVGAKRPFVEYAIYVVHGTKQRRPIVRHVVGGALHISRKRSRENL